MGHHGKIDVSVLQWGIRYQSHQGIPGELLKRMGEYGPRGLRTCCLVGITEITTMRRPGDKKLGGNLLLLLKRLSLLLCQLTLSWRNMSLLWSPIWGNRSTIGRRDSRSPVGLIDIRRGIADVRRNLGLPFGSVAPGKRDTEVHFYRDHELPHGPFGIHAHPGVVHPGFRENKHDRPVSTAKGFLESSLISSRGMMDTGGMRMNPDALTACRLQLIGAPGITHLHDPIGICGVIKLNGSHADFLFDNRDILDQEGVILGANRHSTDFGVYGVQHKVQLCPGIRRIPENSRPGIRGYRSLSRCRRTRGRRRSCRARGCRKR